MAAPRRRIPDLLVRLVDWADQRATGLAVRLSGGVHPKHRLQDSDAHAWYLDALRVTDWVLDFGCGPGGHTIRAARRARSVLGLDLDARLLRRAVSRAVAAGVDNATFMVGGIGSLSAAHHFDAILCLDVLEHVEDRAGLWRVLTACLQPRGLLFLAVPNRDTAWRRRLRAAGLDGRHDPDHRVEYTVGEARREVEAAGFRIRSIGPTTWDTPLAGWIDLVGAVCPPLYPALHGWRRRQGRARPWDATGFQIVAEKSR